MVLGEVLLQYPPDPGRASRTACLTAETGTSVFWVPLATWAPTSDVQLDLRGGASDGPRVHLESLRPPRKEGQARSGRYRTAFSSPSIWYSPGTNPPWELQAKPRASEEARLLVRGRGGHAPTAPSGPVWLCKAHLRIAHETTQRTPDAGAIGRSWCWLGRPGSIAQEKDATVYRRWAHHTHSRSLGCILCILRQQ